MEISVSIGGDSVSIDVSNPFRLDIPDIVKRMESLASSKGAALNGLGLEELIPKMVKGIAGCERGCPADAKDFVQRGFRNFELAYVEGGILTARAITAEGKELSVKIFPDF